MAISKSEERLVVATVAIAALLPLLHYMTRRKTREAKGTYPPYAPNAGVFATIKAIGGPEAPWFLVKSAAKVGSVFRLKLPVPCPMVVAVGDPVLTKDILTDPLSKKPNVFYDAFAGASKGPSIFSETSEIPWKNARKGVSPAFSSQHVRRMNRICSEQTERWIKERLEPMVEAGESFDVADEMIGLTMGVICESAFEYTPSQQETDEFLTELTIALREFSLKQSINPLRRTFGALIPEVRRAQLASDRLQAFALRIMKAYRDSDHHSTEDTVIGRIIDNKMYKDDQARASDVTTFLVAGHDTTGFSLAWILLELARHPEELEKLRSETLKVPRDQWTKTDALRNVVKEGMRLHPVGAIGSIRQTGRDFYTTSKPRYFIPAGSIAIVSQIIPNHSPELYDEPTKFKPCRWLNPSEAAQMGFLPFSLGARNCVGQRLADAELHSVVARLCTHYNFTVENGGTSDYFLTLKPVGARLMAHRVSRGAAVD